MEKGVPLPLAAIHNVRSMVSLSNLCDLLSTCLKHPEAAGKILLVSDGDDWSTPELIRNIAKVFNIRVYLIPLPVVILKLIGVLVRQSAAVSRLTDSLKIDISYTTKVLDWIHPQSPSDGVKDVVEHYVTNKNE